MKNERLLEFASPEWSANPEGQGVICSQYGAYLAFQASGVGEVRLTFADEYSGLTWTLMVDGQDEQQLTVDGTNLVIALREEKHQYQLILDQWDTNQVAFWQQGLILSNLAFEGVADVMAILPNEEESESRPYITFVGDSIVAGELMAGVAHDRHRPSQSFPAIVARDLKQPLNRIAYGGTGLTNSAPFQEPKAIDALWRVGQDVPRRRVHTDKVVVAYGLNDANYGATAEDFAFGLRVYLLELVKRFHQAHFYLLTPWNGQFKEIFEEEASRFDCFTIVDTSSWQIATRPTHPDVAAHAKIAKELELIL
ncbi:GDSL-type esterase/lipase family protein [Fructobacillus durionis]|uniref:GDSL-like Lipase/Acylhydrolase family protein n=1 Tax=Fructobacillus durionis TaxID=283737 RepID=A0A1I1FAR5_9LACO|nr:GDSL-type esterase/lipase family protein [Fructobacillus durionis]SFB96477.1 GDSL-like Lipase/Acylhydrolase family protein [Fructobacillus durionis]